jgi:hypothetical protein
MAHTIPIQTQMNDSTLAPALSGGLLHRLTPFNTLLRDRIELEDYLATHSDLAPLLEGICARLRDVFGLDAELSLEFYKDPEQQDQYPIVYVRQQKYEAGVLKRIESVMSPFMAQLEDASGHLLVTTDFRRP